MPFNMNLANYKHIIFATQKTEQQRIKDELNAATQSYPNKPGCPLRLADPEENPLQMEA